jgi:hypothetical protein
MNVSSLLITNSQPPVLMQPRQGALDYPASLAQATPMISSSLPDHRLDQPLSQLTIMSLRMIRRVALKDFWPFPGPTPLAADGRNIIYQRKQLRHVVAVRLRDMDRKGNPLSFGNEVVFRPLFAAIRRVRPRFGPPKVARTEELSITARLKSILLLPLSLLNNTLWMASHTPAFCQACKYRQQLIPLPHPSSWGSISQGMPLFSTKRMPVRARRGSIGFRPGYFLRRGFGGGSTLRISSQSPSGINPSIFTLPSQWRRAYRISKLSGSLYVRASNFIFCESQFLIPFLILLRHSIVIAL